MELPKIEAQALVHENLVPAVIDEVYQDMAMHVCTRQPVQCQDRICTGEEPVRLSKGWHSVF